MPLADVETLHPEDEQRLHGIIEIVDERLTRTPVLVHRPGRGNNTGTTWGGKQPKQFRPQRLAPHVGTRNLLIRKG